MTGATGRNGIDLDSAARDEIRRAEQFFAAEDGRVSTIEYSDRIEMVVDGQPAVRYTAQVTNIPRQSTCDPPSAQFDVVATKGFSTAEVMVLIVQLDQGIPGSRGPSVADRIISSLRVS
ncbi:hypothetical protein DW322_02165 [Rhodococcus rhodnii]|uniref:DUF8017 domain-containing protein n=1 Tax=Rhodococcus rhodnii TaxID=38312 RepID=A0A6P2C939_9NOCA|nr:hypothetical protein DW322_02165 [Rhodococcus rhodnii]